MSEIEGLESGFRAAEIAAFQTLGGSIVFHSFLVFNMPTTTSILLSKAISLGLSESERALITPPLLAQLAAGRHITLTPTDRRRMPKTTLAILAIGGFIELTRYERDSFSPHTLVMLALSGRAELKESELVRLSAELRTVVKSKSDETRYGSSEEKLHAKFNNSK